MCYTIIRLAIVCRLCVRPSIHLWRWPVCQDHRLEILETNCSGISPTVANTFAIHSPMITYLLPGERGKFELSGKLALGIYILRDSPKFSEHPVGYRAHCAVTFAIAWLSCYILNLNTGWWLIVRVSIIGIIYRCVLALSVPEFSVFDEGGGVINVTWYWPPTQTKDDVSHLIIAVTHRRHGRPTCHLYYNNT